MKTPPHRFGLSFKVGATLEARDRHNNWYSASIEQIDYDRERVCVHFTKWSRRHNQWISWNSANIRPAERDTQRYVPGSKVVACWTDGRFYPAKILKVNRDDSYTVRFYDGVVLTVKKMKIKPFKEAAADDDDEEEEMMKMRAEPSSSNPESFRSHSQPITADTALPAAAPSSAHINEDVHLERQIHLPTTHKFSREPLYRVIKNQPPLIFSIDLDHNPFKCPDPGCTKSFRKSSLLHDHIKYYHRGPGLEPIPGAAEQDVLRCSLDTAQKKKKKEKKKKDRKSLRVKLKKKKKKRWSHTGFSSDEEKSDSPTFTERIYNTHTQDEGSDWSTLTAESGEDTPPWAVAMEMEGCELVRCVCEVKEEKDFMIQCESCLCWQHGVCFGLCEENVPPRFICHHCTGWRRAQHDSSDCDWWRSGHMFSLSCVKDSYWTKNAARIKQTTNLMKDVHVLNQVLRGLQLRMALLHTIPELQQLPWKQDESMSYISSDHSYTQTHTFLLHNVNNTQQEIHNRLELLDTQLDALEAWLDQSELEPAEPLSRLPQLKQRIRRLLGDLCVVKKLSVCVSV